MNEYTYLTRSKTTRKQSDTPGLRQKIPVFSDPAPGKSYATTYEQMGS